MLRKVALFRCKELTYGFLKSLTFWRSAIESRSIRSIATRLIPLYVVATGLGMWCWILDLLCSDFRQKTIISVTWSMGCMIPLYLIGSLIQSRFIAKISSFAASSSTIKLTKWSYVLSETVYGVILGVMHILLTSILTTLVYYLTPTFVSVYLNIIISVLSVAWTTSFSSFECALIASNRNLHERISFIETHWTFAFSFGLWSSIFYHILPSAIALPLWQYSLLLLTMHSMKLDLTRLPMYGYTSRLEEIPLRRIRVFYWAQRCADVIIGIIISIWKPKILDQPEPVKQVAKEYAKKPSYLDCVDWKCPKQYGDVLDKFTEDIRNIVLRYENPRSVERTIRIVFEFVGTYASDGNLLITLKAIVCTDDNVKKMHISIIRQQVKDLIEKTMEQHRIVLK